MEQYRLREERTDRRAALAAWVHVEVARDRDKRTEPFRLTEIVDWLGHGFQRPTPAPPPESPPTPEALIERLQLFEQLYGEGKLSNGAQAEG